MFMSKKTAEETAGRVRILLLDSNSRLLNDRHSKYVSVSYNKPWGRVPMAYLLAFKRGYRNSYIALFMDDISDREHILN